MVSLIDPVTAYFASLTVFQAGLLATFIASLGTGVGAVPIILVRRASAQVKDVLLGTAAGLMLGAVAFSLVLPALDSTEDLGYGPASGAALVGVALLLGAVALWGIHHVVPHEHLHKGPEGAEGFRGNRLWLFVLAIALHNFPEGLAVGVGFGGGDSATGLVLMLVIFLQNLPEGFIVALAILSMGGSLGKAIGIALLTGLVELFGGLFGASMVSLSAQVLPWALGGAAGAMLFVIGHEIIPETHRRGHETPATFGLLFGFAVMMWMDRVIV